jgi:hypothetical protein
LSSESAVHQKTAVPQRRCRRRWAVVGLVAVVLLALALTPPFLNVNRLQRRIAASMSASLGRPVHLDRVTMHLLPVPGFTLENLVVSEDPAFGDEPVIRANTVEVTLRPSSLWRRQVELSTIRFVEPSLNLVRNTQGRWNLQSLLMHAASMDTAPTAQSTPGPAPRFPYIEATSGRVNVKIGAEKKPFSLTDADFALWLPTPAAWRIRLEAKPARTDENLSDPGTIKLAGSLQRAASMADVPVDLTASWEGAPLGEASRLLTGDDANWRGQLNVEVTLAGKLGAAKLTTKVHGNDLRRADFVPAKSLEVTVDCTAIANITTAVATSPACKLSAPDVGSLLVSAVADRVDLSGHDLAEGVSGLSIGTPGIPEAWLLDWARLFSQRIPAREAGAGKLDGSLRLIPGAARAASFWQGTLHAEIGSLPGLPSAPDQASRAGLTVSSDAEGATLEPLNLMPADSMAPLMLSARATPQGITLQLAGTATPNQLHALIAAAPPLGDGLAAALPELATTLADKPMKLDVSCERSWRGPQVCATSAVEPVKKKRRR